MSCYSSPVVAPDDTPNPSSEELPPLPPLDPDDDGEGPRDDRPVELLVDLDETDVDLDDQEAGELDVGIQLDELPHESAEVRGEIVLDIAELLAIDEEGAADDADEPGPEAFDPSIGLSEPAGEIGDDDVSEEPMDDLLDEDLPSIDADAEGDFDGEAFGELDTFVDERPPPESSTPWPVTAIASDEVRAIAAFRGGVLLSQGALKSYGRGTTPSASYDARVVVTSLATLDGALALGIGPARSLVRLEGDTLTELGPVAEFDDERSGVTPLLAATAGEFLALSPSGRVLTSVRGEDWQPAGPSDVLAMSADGAFAVTRARAYRRSASSGGFEPVVLDPAALDVLRGDAPRVAAGGRWVLLSERTRGVALSVDGGSTFRRVDGSAGTVAIAIARHDGRPLLLGVLAATLENGPWLFCIDPQSGRAERVAEFGVGDDAGEDVVVAGMTWNAADDALWIAGSFGALAVRPTPQGT